MPILYDGNTSFSDACAEAIAHQIPLHITTNIELSETIRLNSKQVLQIIGGGNPRPRLSGNLHSLCLLHNRSRLILQGVHLQHTRDPATVSEVGAAIQLRSHASALLRDCHVHSHAGFGLWAVQHATVVSHHCHYTAPARSTVVAFGKAQVHLEDCVLRQAGVHAVCARGACHLRLDRCSILDAVVRGVYAYGGAAVELRDCTVRGTLRRDKAAIEVCVEETSAVTIVESSIVENQGMGVLIRSHSIADPEDCSQVSLQGNRIEHNTGGDLVYQEQPSDGTTTSDKSPLMRSGSETSYRIGDWYCSKCVHILNGQASTCPTCHGLPGQSLSRDHILASNQGLATWWFDIDDDDRGWHLYDATSRRALEKAHEQGCERILLQDGKYLVNLLTMQQINVESQFPRKVQRRVV